MQIRFAYADPKGDGGKKTKTIPFPSTDRPLWPDEFCEVAEEAALLYCQECNLEYSGLVDLLPPPKQGQQ